MLEKNGNQQRKAHKILTESEVEGTMKRRADEIDIILYDDYVWEDNETRYGDIWRKKSKLNEITPGYENI